MKTLLQLLSVCLLPFSAVAADTSSQPILQMRLVLDAPDADAEQMLLVNKGKDRDDTETVYVEKTILLDQTMLASAKVTINSLDGRPRIEMVFTATGKKRFAEVTRKNVDKRLAIIIDGKLYSAPTIRMEIPGGRAEVSGSFSEQEARVLAAKIRGTLPEH